MTTPEESERIERFRHNVERNPDNALHRFSLGKALLDAGRREEAEPHLREALSRRDDWMVVVILLAECALRRGDAPSARSLYERALQLAISQNHQGPESDIRAALASLPHQ